MIAVMYREGQRVGLAYGVDYREEMDYDEQGEPVAHRVSGSAAQLRTLRTFEIDGYDFELVDAPGGPITLRDVRLDGPLLSLRQGLSGTGVGRVSFQAREVATPPGCGASRLDCEAAYRKDCGMDRCGKEGCCMAAGHHCPHMLENSEGRWVVWTDPPQLDPLVKPQVKLQERLPDLEARRRLLLRELHDMRQSEDARDILEAMSRFLVGKIAELQDELVRHMMPRG